MLFEFSYPIPTSSQGYYFFHKLVFQGEPIPRLQVDITPQIVPGNGSLIQTPVSLSIVEKDRDY